MKKFKNWQKMPEDPPPESEMEISDDEQEE